ncbi:hypothetical protein [Sanguibacter suaedae]|uniref:Alpha/beta hydrolase n=1 Tax=Sanguibacter suaedae TaxID=2795737 RepID=A0A934MEI0_9MICO|nr:hypothetical protein [Sanguibacter suaedae]MBI9115709.1 hypothetical protein [Sanguibacter suaedae]
MNDDDIIIQVIGGVGGIAASTQDMESAAALVRSAVQHLDDARSRCAMMVADLALLRFRTVLTPSADGDGSMTRLYIDSAIDTVSSLSSALSLQVADLETLASGVLNASVVYGSAEASVQHQYLDLLGGTSSWNPMLHGLTITSGIVQSSGTSWKDKAAGGLGAWIGSYNLFRNPFTTPGVDDAARVLKPAYSLPTFLGRLGSFRPGDSWTTLKAPPSVLDLQAGHLTERRTLEPPVTSVTQAAQQIGTLGPGGGVHPPGTVKVQRIDQPDGSETWSVLIPGTDDWTPGADSVFAGEANLDLMGYGEGRGMDLVESALMQAGAPVGATVGLYAHSQGGIVAMELADDDTFRRRYTLSNVTTFGSPVAHITPAQPVPTLHVENNQELVSSLDQGVSPDLLDRVTVSADVPTSDVLEAHSPFTHATVLDTAIAGGDPSVLAAVEQQEAVLGRTPGSVGATSLPQRQVETFYLSPGFTTAATDPSGAPVCVAPPGSG